MTPGNDTKRILIVDDNVELRDQIRGYLTGHDFAIEVATDAVEMDRILKRRQIDLILLDLMLPGEDGLSICRRIAQRGEPPIIMISAAGEEVDRVLGLEFGAEDYLTKPFGPRELLARIRVVLRRQREARLSGRSPSYAFQGFTYEPVRRELRAADGTMILLTGSEATLLGLLLTNSGRGVARDELMNGDAGPDSRALDLVVSRLRHKLSGHGGEHLIMTRRGHGYMLRCNVVTQ